MKKAAKENDYLGMNHYQSHFIKAYDGENEIHHNGTGEKGTKKFKLKGVGERVFKEGIPTTDWDWLIYPQGMYDMIMRIKKQYPNYKAIYITENGMGYKDDFNNGNIDDSPRIDSTKKSIFGLMDALAIVNGMLLFLSLSKNSVAPATKWNVSLSSLQNSR